MIFTTPGWLDEPGVKFWAEKEMGKMNPKLLAILTIILWSFGSYLGRLIAIKSQFMLLAFSFFFSSVTLLIYSSYFQKENIYKILKPFNYTYLLVGPLGYFVYSIAINQSSRSFNSMSETTILNYTWPVFTVLFTDTFFTACKSKSKYFQIIEILSIGLGFAAVTILATKGNFSAININLSGLIWGLLAGASYGFFSAYSGTLNNYEQLRFLLVAVFVSIILISFLSISELDQIRNITVTDLWVTFTLGCLLNGIGYITWTGANRLARVRNINISSVASLMFTLPVVNLVIVGLLLGEDMLSQPYFLVSLGLVLVGTVLSQRAEALALWFEDQIA